MTESRQSDQAEQPEPEPTNRAERRAQGKKAKATQQFPDQQQQRFHGRSGVQSPRQYGRRRSG